MLFILLAALFGQSSADAAAKSLLNSLIFNGCDVADARAFPASLQRRAQEYVERCRAFRPQVRSLPGLSAGEQMMTDSARQNYERRLWAAAHATPDAAARAAAYVEALGPCYEWEGFHDCPEAEAVFADQYASEHPSSPLADYLPLLAAHRWVCAAEAYDYERTSGVPASQGGVGAARARQSFQRDLTQALASRDPLVRFAAGELQRTGTCFHN